MTTAPNASDDDREAVAKLIGACGGWPINLTDDDDRGFADRILAVLGERGWVKVDLDSITHSVYEALAVDCDPMRRGFLLDPHLCAIGYAYPKVDAAVRAALGVRQQSVVNDGRVQHIVVTETAAVKGSKSHG